MNRQKIFDYFRIAAILARKNTGQKSFLLGAIGVRNDGVMVKAVNSPSVCPERKVHAEYRLSNKLDYGAVVYVVRVRLLDNKLAIARPCISCQKVLTSKKVSKVYYSISEYEWGVWGPGKNDEYFSKFSEVEA